MLAETSADAGVQSELLCVEYSHGCPGRTGGRRVRKRVRAVLTGSHTPGSMSCETAPSTTDCADSGREVKRVQSCAVSKGRTMAPEQRAKRCKTEHNRTVRDLSSAPCRPRTYRLVWSRCRHASSRSHSEIPSLGNLPCVYVSHRARRSDWSVKSFRLFCSRK